jgi:hypothetical protein
MRGPMRTFIPPVVAAFVVAIGVVVPASAQIKGPVTPALTPGQIALSKSLAARHNQADAKEQRRLETFKDVRSPPSSNGRSISTRTTSGLRRK